MKLSDILAGKTDTSADCGSAEEVFLAYARVSTPDQEKKGLSIPAQISEMQEYARRKGIQIAGIYKEAESAFSDESRRPEFARMVKHACDDPRISGILVHDSSRFCRNPYEGPKVKGKLKNNGVRIVSVTEPEFDPDTVSGLALEKMTEFRNASFSLDVAFHTRKGMRENIARRDPEVGYCYKNGGAPPWGFKAYKVERGSNRRGEPIRKTLWEKDDTVVAGKQVWEWAYQVLVQLRLERRLSLDAICDFLNKNGVPAVRKTYWSPSSVYALTRPASLLQFAGYGVWNVHRKGGGIRPSSEWEIVENAHPAIISMEQAEKILQVNEQMGQLFKDQSKGRMASVRTKGSRFLLTGGLFVCGRCGSAMVGYHNQNRLYYCCGASYYRKGRGCGEGFQVPKDGLESSVIQEIGEVFTSFSDPSKVKKLVEDEVRGRTNRESCEAESIRDELRKVTLEMENVRKAIKAGLDDVDWANSELRELKARREELEARQKDLAVQPVPRILDHAVVEEYLKTFERTFEFGTNEEKRELVRLFVKKVELNPETGDIAIRLLSRPPGIMTRGKRTPARKETGVPIGLVAGACFVPEWNQDSVHISRWILAGVKQGIKRMQRVGLTV